MTDSTACSSCKSPIHAGAKKCHVCQSWQTARKYFDFSSVVSSVLVSCITIGVFFATPIKGMIFDKEPEIDSYLISSNPDRLHIMISNAGDASAGIKLIYFEIGESGNKMRVPAGEDNWGTLIKPSDILSLKLKMGYHSLPTIASKYHKAYSELDKENCNLVIEYVSLTDTKSSPIYRAPFECYNLTPIKGSLEDTRF